MDNVFNLSFDHNGRQYDLEAVFQRVGYIHQFHVQLDGQTLIVEFDEERNYRVIGSNGARDSGVDQNFLKALVEKISSLH